MNNPINNIQWPKFCMHFSVILIIVTGLISCSRGNRSGNDQENDTGKQNVIEIITEDMEFQMTDEIPSGWTTFRYLNKSVHTHFFLLDKYPEGKTLEDGEREVIPVFQSGMDLINEGKAEEGYAEFSKLPEWFGQIVFMGGSGLVSPNQVAETTLHMKPGLYVVECYVKMENGMFHTTMGMTKELNVTSDITDYSPMEPDVNISISSTEGILYDRKITKGEHTFSVSFKDQIAHENFVGHDINLVRLDNLNDIVTLEKWMNWADPKGLITPAPEGLTFLGGVNDMPAGSKAYFSADLEPGNYALVSEVPQAISKNMLKTFIVSE